MKAMNRYTTYRLPKNIKALICVLAGMLTLSVAINIYIVFAGTKKEPQKVTEVYPMTTTQETTMETTTETTTGAVEAVKYYDVPLSHELQDYIRDNAYGLDIALVLAVIEVESDYTSDVISETNDWGLMQINECNHDWLADEYGLTDMLNEYQNIDAGMLMLSMAIDQASSMHGALMIYNCGLSGAQELWEAEVYETNYSRKVLDKYEEIRRTK